MLYVALYPTLHKFVLTYLDTLFKQELDYSTYFCHTRGHFTWFDHVLTVSHDGVSVSHDCLCES